MHTFQFYVVGCAACILCIDLHACAIEDSNVLENLKDFDSLYESGFTVSGTRQSNDQILMSSSRFGVKRRWRLTFGGDRVGYQMEVIDYEKPKYQRPKRQLPDGDETLRMSVRIREWGYWGFDLSGHHYEDTVIAVTAAGEVTETAKMHNSMLFGPRDEGPNAPKRVALWSLGRFFSNHVDKVTQVEESEDGRLVVSALGKKSEGQNGRWELEIEPAAAWMVRKARFYWDIKPDRINVEMRNEGTVWSGSYCIPKEAEINHWGPIEGVETERLTFEPVVEEFDEKLYGTTQQAVAHNQTPTLTLHDYRVSPSVITEPFRPKPTEALPAKRDSARTWFLVVVNLVMVTALIMLLMLRKLRRTDKGAVGK